MSFPVPSAATAPTAAAASSASFPAAVAAASADAAASSSALPAAVVPSDAKPDPVHQLHCRECESVQRHVLVHQVSHSKYHDEAEVVQRSSHQRFRCTSCALMFDRYLTAINDMQQVNVCDDEGEPTGESVYEEFYKDTSAQYHDFFPNSDVGEKGEKVETAEAKETEDTMPVSRFLIKSETRNVLLKRAPKILILMEESEAVARAGAWYHWATGLKLILEAVCQHFDIPEDATHNNLKKRVDELHSKMVPELRGKCDMRPLLEAMHMAREGGNEVAHMLQLPSRKVRDMCFQLMDHLLVALFVAPARMDAIIEELSTGRKFAATPSVAKAAEEFQAAAEVRLANKRKQQSDFAKENPQLNKAKKKAKKHARAAGIAGSDTKISAALALVANVLC